MNEGMYLTLAVIVGSVVALVFTIDYLRSVDIHSRVGRHILVFTGTLSFTLASVAYRRLFEPSEDWSLFFGTCIWALDCLLLNRWLIMRKARRNGEGSRRHTDGHD